MNALTYPVRPRPVVWLLALCCALLACPDHAWAAKRVEAVPGKEYPLGKENGPWMILVTSFRGDDARKYANELVHELRSDYHLPAYLYFFEFGGREHELKARMEGRATPIRYRQYKEVAVLVGDFRTNDGDAQKVLEKVKKITPKSIPPDIAPVRARTQGPLRNAFVTKNPYIPKEQFLSPESDRLVMRMNGGSNSLFECPGQYSLLVAKFVGTVTLKTAKPNPDEPKGTLADAGETAEELASQLRKGGLQAYTWHDRRFSIVTVGSFQAQADRAIGQLQRRFAGQKIGQWELEREPFLVQVPKK